MQPFQKITSKIAPLDLANIDTDQIIPKNFLKRIERTGFGQFLFYDWRYLPDGKENPNFVLNKKEHQGAKILLTRENFGCGSSREHAPWALLDYGFQVIIAPSFADIFYNNCFQNGILPIKLSQQNVQELFEKVAENPYLNYTVDLEKQEILSEEGRLYTFSIAPNLKEKLLKGLDDIGYTLQFLGAIEKYEQERDFYRILGQVEF